MSHDKIGLNVLPETDVDVFCHRKKLRLQLSPICNPAGMDYSQLDGNELHRVHLYSEHSVKILTDFKESEARSPSPTVDANIKTVRNRFTIPFVNTVRQLRR